MPTLLLRLEGPMQSYGTQSRHTVRDTEREPTKSAVIGLIASAMGIAREAFKNNLRLTEMRMGVRIDRPGKILVDYQTTTGMPPLSQKTDGYPILPTDRYYLSDASFLVGLETPDEELAGSVWNALSNPVWAPFLGRRAFVPSKPIAEEQTQEPLEPALRNYPWFARTAKERMSAPERLRYVIETTPGDGREIRLDVPVSFDPINRRYRPRNVRTSFFPLSKELVKEDPVCFLPK